ncbi:MAG: BTAD domain-containing putative transcriptional regulator, partial [Gammaproteobacteria bacterium]
SLPKGCTIYVISRTPPPACFSRLIANDRIALVTWQQLRLTPDEVGDIVKERGISDLDASEVEKLASMCRGWMAGLTLLLRSEGREVGEILGRERSPQVLFDYFAEEIFARQPRENQYFLMQSALLPAINKKAVVELAGTEKFWKTLVRLHEQNYFTDYLTEPEPAFQFHPLFRDFLLNQLGRRFSGAELRDLRRHVARIAESAEQTGVAIRLYCASRSYHDCVRLLNQAAPSLLRQGRARTLDEWIGVLPMSLARRFPRLDYWRGICRLFDDPDMALELFESSFRGCLAESDFDGAQWAWAGGVHAILITWTEFHRLAEWVARGEKLVAAAPGFESTGVEISFNYAMCLAVIFSQPEHQRRGELVDQTIKLMQRPQSLSQQLMTGNLLLQHLAWMGAVAKARILVEVLRNRVRQAGATDEQQLSLLAAEASLGLTTGQPVAALNFAEEGMALSEESGISVWRHKLNGVAAHANLLLGRCDRAREYLRDDSDGLPATQNLLWWHHHWLFAWCEWLSGRPQDAREHLTAAKSILEIAGWPDMPTAKYHVGRAAVMFELGDIDTARRSLDEAGRIARRVGSGFLSHQCAMMDALFALDDETEASARAGALAMETGRESDLLVVDWFDRRRMGRLCARLLDRGTETQHVRRVIQAHRLPPPDVAESLETWPWSVKVYALGGFRLLVDGQQVSDGAKRQKKVIELLKALIARGGTQVSEAILSESLWPDAEADAGHNSLKTSIHRLRQLLGRSDAVKTDNGGFSLNPDCCWVDAWEVEKLLRPGDSTGTQRIDRLRRGIELYRGMLFDGDDDAWMLSLRERLQEKVRAAIEEVGRYWERLEEWQSSIEIYEYGLTLDACAESFYRRLMVCHEQLGHHADAIIIYERCRRRLDRRLGVAPSRSTQALAREIRHH